MAESKEALEATTTSETSNTPFEDEYSIRDLKLFRLRNDREFKAFIERLGNSSKLKTLRIYLKSGVCDIKDPLNFFDIGAVTSQEHQTKILHDLQLICQTVKANKVQVVFMDVNFVDIDFSLESLTIFRNLVQNENIILSGSLYIPYLFTCNGEFFTQYAALLNNVDSFTTLWLMPAYFKETPSASPSKDQFAVRLAMLIAIAKQTKLSFELNLYGERPLQELSLDDFQLFLKSLKDLDQVSHLSFFLTTFIEMNKGEYNGVFDWLPGAACLSITFIKPPVNRDLQLLTKYLQQSRAKTVKFLLHRFFNVEPECFQEFTNAVFKSSTIESVTLDDPCPASLTSPTSRNSAFDDYLLDTVVPTTEQKQLAENAEKNFRKMCEILSTDSNVRKLHILGISGRGLPYLPHLLEAILRSNIRVLTLQNILFNPDHGEPYIDEYGFYNNGINFALNGQNVQQLCELISRMTTLHELNMSDVNNNMFDSKQKVQLLDSIRKNVSLISFCFLSGTVIDAMNVKVQEAYPSQEEAETAEFLLAKMKKDGYISGPEVQNKIDEILLVNRHKRLIWAAYALCRAPICNKSKLPDALKDLVLSFLDGREQQFKEKQKTYRQKHPNSNVLFHYGRITASAEAKWGAKTSASDKRKDIEHGKGKRRGLR